MAEMAALLADEVFHVAVQIGYPADLSGCAAAPVAGQLSLSPAKFPVEI